MVRKFLKKGERLYNVNKIISLYHKHKHIGIVEEITGVQRKTISRYLKENNIKKYKRWVREEHRYACGNAMRGKHISDYPKHKEAMQKRRGENHPLYKPKVKCNCNWCNKELYKHECQIKNVIHISCGSKECKTAQRKYYSKEMSPHWKGGPNSITGILRASDEYKDWRKLVYKRDNWTCQECDVRGGYICAHHIKEVCNYPELIFDMNNGQTLCLDCHKETPNYLYKANRRDK